MRKFLTWEYLSHSYIDFSVPGFVLNTNHDLSVYTQTDPVMRVRVEEVAASVAVEIDTGAQYSTGDTLSLEFACKNGDALCIPLGDALHAAYRPDISALTVFPDTYCMTCAVTVTLLDGDGEELNHADMVWRVYDGIGCQMLTHGAFFSLLPERMRMLAGVVNPVTVPIPVFDVEMTRRFANGTSSSIGYLGNVGAVSFVVQPNNRLSGLSLSIAGEEPVSSVVEWVECADSAVLLAWWSTEHCGWKSAVADVLAETAEAVTRRDVAVGFGMQTGTETDFSLSVRFPLCSPRDVAWLRDILASGIVYRYAEVCSYASSSGSGVWLPVRVRGSFPSVETAGGVKNIEFNILTQNTDNL